MKKEIVRFATTISLLATSVYGQQAVDSASPASIRTTTVNDLAANPSIYLGPVAVVGVVAAVKDTQGFTIVDKREFAACGLSCLDEPETRKIPVRWNGASPKPQETVRITGVLEKSEHGLMFSARNVEEAAKE